MGNGTLLEPQRLKPRAKPTCAKVVIAAPKGGVGKTTVVMALLVCARTAGFRVAGVNTDEQPSLTNWGKFREAQRRNPAASGLVDVPILTRRLDDYRQVNREVSNSYDIAFIDTPPGHSHYRGSVQSLCETADLVLIPTGPSDVDLDEVIPFRMQTAGDKAVFLLNAVNRRASSYLRARQRLIKVGLLCPVDVPRLEVIHTQYKLGLASPDTGDKGADDFTAVWEFVRREVGL